MFKHSFKGETNMSGYEKMKKRIAFHGVSQDDRNVSSKLNSMKSALLNSYQAEDIMFNDKKCRCLINPEKMTTDYDQKIISIEFDAGMGPGDTFYWIRDNSHWIVYNVFEEEEAYFRARIRKCQYTVEVNGKEYWTYVRGPVETALIWAQKHGIYRNNMNYSILLYVTKNEETLKAFSRLNTVKFEGHNWRVATTDKYSQAGIIEVYLEEAQDNEMLDYMVEEEPPVIENNRIGAYIDGPAAVDAYDIVTYSIKGTRTLGEFYTDSKKVSIIDSDDKTCEIEILTGKTSSFDLIYRTQDKEIIAQQTIAIKSF